MQYFLERGLFQQLDNKQVPKKATEPVTGIIDRLSYGLIETGFLFTASELLLDETLIFA